VINAAFQPKPEKKSAEEEPDKTSGAAKKQKNSKLKVNIDEFDKSINSSNDNNLQPATKAVKEAPGKKKQPSMGTQTLDKYRLVKKLPVNRMLKAVPKVQI
jgi:hypothetical protein